MQPSRQACALSFMPDRRLAYERVMTEARDILHILNKRFFTFTQQQYMFVKALDNSRIQAFEPYAVISSLTQVAHYTKNISKNATDKRIMKMFLVMVRDLQEFRRTLSKIAKQSDERLEEVMLRWKRLLEPTLNISKLRAKYPNTQLNHLSVDEKRNFFGGIVSVLPLAMECAKEALHRIELTRVYRPAKTVRKYNKGDLIAPKAKPQRPCVLQEEKPRKQFNYCKRIPSPSSTISSPVRSEISIKQVHSEDLTARQVQDCKTHRVLSESENPHRDCNGCRRRSVPIYAWEKKGRAEPVYAWETTRERDDPAWETNKCLWRNKTCSEEFVDKMLSEKRRRDRKEQHCKY